MLINFNFLLVIPTLSLLKSFDVLKICSFSIYWTVAWCSHILTKLWNKTRYVLMVRGFPTSFSKWVVQMAEHKEWISETDNDLSNLYYFQNSNTLQRLQLYKIYFPVKCTCYESIYALYKTNLNSNEMFLRSLLDGASYL